MWDPWVDEVRWFRFLHDTLDDQEWQTLSPEAFKLAVNLLSFASMREGSQRGTLPNLKGCAFRLRMSVGELNDLLPELEDAGIIEVRGDVPVIVDAERHYRASDNSAERTAEWRARNKQDGVTSHVTSHVTARDGHSDADVTDERRGEERRGEETAPTSVGEPPDGGGNGTALVPSASLGLSLRLEEMQVWEAFDIARGAVTSRASLAVKERRLAACRRAVQLGIGPTDIVQAAAAAPAANRGMGEDALLNTVLGQRGQHHLQSSHGKPGILSKAQQGSALYQQMQARAKSGD